MKRTPALQRFLAVLAAAPLFAACGSSKGTPEGRESSAGNAAAAGMSPADASGGAGSTTGGGNGDPPADPDVTRHYTWEACGTIPASTEAYDVVSASDGTFAFEHQDRIVVYDHGDFSRYRELRLACSDSAFGCEGALALSPDAAFLAQGLAIFDTADGTFVRDLTPPDGGLCDTTHVVFSPTGDGLLSFGKNGLCNFRGADGSTFTRLTGAVSRAAFDGDVLTVIEETPGSDLPSVVRYDLSGTEISRIATELAPVGLSPDGSYVACASASEPVVGLCDRDGQLLWSTEGYGSATFSPDGSLVLLGASTFRVDGGERVADFDDRWLNHPIALAPDGRAVGIAYRTGAIWFDDDPLPTSLHGHAIASDADPLRSLAMTPDGGALLSVGVEALRWRIAPVFTESVATMVSGAPYLGRGEISPDGRWAAVAGDGRIVVDMTTGAVAPIPYSSLGATNPCIWLQLKFSPDSRFVVGSGQGRSIEVFRTGDFARVAAISTPDCNVRVAFSMTTSTLMTSELMRYSTDTWRPTEQASSSPGSSEFGPFDDIVLSERDLNVAFSRDCKQVFEDTGEREVCRTTVTGPNSADPSALDAPFPSFSPEGHWLVAGNRLVHLPSGETRAFDETASVSIFAPNGDIVAGTRDGSLTRYCRHD